MSGTREDDDTLVLSTAHSAKGKEWDAVFVIWAVDGWFPSARCLNSDEETEEEQEKMADDFFARMRAMMGS